MGTVMLCIVFVALGLYYAWELSGEERERARDELDGFSDKLGGFNDELGGFGDELGGFSNELGGFHGPRVVLRLGAVR